MMSIKPVFSRTLSAICICSGLILATAGCKEPAAESDPDVFTGVRGDKRLYLWSVTRPLPGGTSLYQCWYKAETPFYNDPATTDVKELFSKSAVSVNRQYIDAGAIYKRLEGNANGRKALLMAAGMLTPACPIVTVVAAAAAGTATVAVGPLSIPAAGLAAAGAGAACGALLGAISLRVNVGEGGVDKGVEAAKKAFIEELKSKGASGVMDDWLMMETIRKEVVAIDRDPFAWWPGKSKSKSDVSCPNKDQLLKSGYFGASTAGMRSQESFDCTLRESMNWSGCVNYLTWRQGWRAAQKQQADTVPTGLTGEKLKSLFENCTRYSGAGASWCRTKMFNALVQDWKPNFYNCVAQNGSSCISDHLK